MRTSEKTLIATMGFQDPDRSTPGRRYLHDSAVSFLSQEAVADGIFLMAHSWRHRSENIRGPLTRETEVVLKTRSKFVVGFADLVITEPFAGEFGACVVVEVKTILDDPGAAVRQVKLYADTLGADRTRPCIACVEPPDQAALRVVTDAGIKFIQLGTKFTAFLSCRPEARADVEL